MACVRGMRTKFNFETIPAHILQLECPFHGWLVALPLMFEDAQKPTFFALMRTGNTARSDRSGRYLCAYAFGESHDIVQMVAANTTLSSQGARMAPTGYPAPARTTRGPFSSG